MVKVKFSSLSAPTKIEELTAGPDEKHSAAPPGIEPRVLWILVVRSNHWAMKPRRKCMWILAFHQAVSSFPLRGNPDCPTVYKHAATNENSLDWNPFNRKLALAGIIPNQILFSFSLSELKEKRIWLGMIPTRASLRYGENVFQPPPNLMAKKNISVAGSTPI